MFSKNKNHLESLITPSSIAAQVWRRRWEGSSHGELSRFHGLVFFACLSLLSMANSICWFRSYMHASLPFVRVIATEEYWSPEWRRISQLRIVSRPHEVLWCQWHVGCCQLLTAAMPCIYDDKREENIGMAGVRRGRMLPSGKGELVCVPSVRELVMSLSIAFDCNIWFLKRKRERERERYARPCGKENGEVNEVMFVRDHSVDVGPPKKWPTN
jgi:hypothetical protein